MSVYVNSRAAAKFLTSSILGVRPRRSHYAMALSQTQALPTSSASLRWASSSGKGNKNKNKKKDGVDEATSIGYFERKAKAKQERTQQYEARLQRKSSLKNRRDSSSSSPTKKESFEAWWLGRQAREQLWDRHARQQNKKWKIQVSVLLERPPKILPDRMDFEKDFDELQAYLSQFGKEYPKEFAGTTGQTGEVPISDEDLLDLLPAAFRPAPRITPADEAGQTDTLDRKLQDRIYLMINGEFPTTELMSDDESLLEAAKRIILDEKHTGVTMKKVELYCPSEAPMGVRLTQGDDEDSEYFGTKTFYMRLQYDDGEILSKSDAVAWLNREEVVGKFSMNGEDDSEDEANFYRYLL